MSETFITINAHEDRMELVKILAVAGYTVKIVEEARGLSWEKDYHVYFWRGQE